jgi:hypothetical protein
MVGFAVEDLKQFISLKNIPDGDLNACQRSNP